MTKKIALISLLILSISINGFSQIGGQTIYQFLQLPQTAKIGALGGSSISIWGDDIQLMDQNPSLLNENMHNQFSLVYIDYLKDINNLSVAYAYHTEKYGTFAFSIYSVDYGDFSEYDAYGTELGSFSANETLYQLNWAYPIHPQVQVGARAKLINSLLANYFSYGIAADLGVTYHPTETFSASLVAKNIGTQIDNYYVEDSNHPLPFEMEFSLSKKLSHAPFRLHFSYQYLNNFDLLYEDPSNPSSYVNPLTGELETTSQFELVSNNLFRHLIIGAEFIPSKNFYVDIAFNAQRRYELMLQDKMGAVGFSWGFGLKLSKFKISFSRAIYHLAGGSNHFSISTNLDDFMKKKK